MDFCDFYLWIGLLKYGHLLSNDQCTFGRGYRQCTVTVYKTFYLDPKFRAMDPDADLNPTLECKIALTSEKNDSFGLVYYDPD
jgi:hypothetical protein